VRVVAGIYGGRTLKAPRGQGVRPTADRVREALFSILGPLDGLRALDLFAGTGALGIEALSRGASTATFVELDRYACKVINANLDSLDFRGTVLQQDAVRAVTSERRTYDLILCDPPYGYDHAKVAPHLARLLNEDGVLVYESSGREDPPEVPGLEQRTSRKYGSARLTLFDK
jgi:16S rRNA (guanine966-N2)-methyltransferase